MIDKDKLLYVVQGYVGTPHITGAAVKGAGVDCSTYPKLVFEELGYGPFEYEQNYTGDWYCKMNPEEVLLPYLRKYCVEIDRNETRAGDLISFQYGRATSHLAIILDADAGILTHCHAMNGVEITDYCDPCLMKRNGEWRAVAFWRLKEEA